MLIQLKVKTLDARTHDFTIDNEITIRQLKDQIAAQTNISAENQRIIYQGRVLADEKQVKEYDVDGKVLHVAERPPFSQRGANSRNNDEPRPLRPNAGRPTPANMRNSPFFRALDGMLVGTMAIPVTNGGSVQVGVGGNNGDRNAQSRFPHSSSFCMNRITVALHMIDCANNIAAYLENPEVGLNNQSLDILQRGRWTMESTVVEVGVSTADALPRNNNFMDIVQDAVTAALSRNTTGRNYTVVQLPTMYASDGSADGAQRNAADGSQATSDTSEETTTAAVIIEDVVETDEEIASDRSSTPLPHVSNGANPAGGSTSMDEGASGAEEGAGAVGGDQVGGESNVALRRATRPQVLADAIERYRTVQTRLSPFVDQYHAILRDDPNFEEEDNAGRVNAQRIFDRVSEAIHYLSHAQHAISDLMLDLSQSGPRVLTCRPILVEQSGYIRSNNILTPNIVATPLTQIVTRQQAPQTQSQPTAAQAQTTQDTSSSQPTPLAPTAAPQTVQTSSMNAAMAARAAAQAAQRAMAAASAAASMAQEASGVAAAAMAATAAVNDQVEDPVDEPMVAPTLNVPPAAATAPAPGTGAQQQQQRLDMDDPVPRLRLYMPVTLPPPNPHAQMARLIQAVVNNATNDADLHMELNAPNILSINLPVHVMAAAVHPQPPPPTRAPVAPPARDQAANSDSGGPATAASTSTGTRSGEQRANTLPTTATQTRSTSRPQIQIGGNNNWGGRVAPSHTAFDRFLPCNSHHIREPEPPNNNNTNNTNANVNQVNNETNNSSSSSNANENVVTTTPPIRSTGGVSAAGAPTVVANLVIPRPRYGRSGANNSNWVTRRRLYRAPRDNNAAAHAVRVADRVLTNINRQITTRSPSPSIITFLLNNRLLNTLLNISQVALTGRVATAARVVNPSGVATNAALNTTPPSATITTSSTAPSASSVGQTSTGGGESVSISTTTTTTTTSDVNNLRTQLRNFLHHTVFEGAPINDETIAPAIGRALAWFGETLVYLPQYERSEYNSRDSVCNILRLTLRLVIELCNSDNGAQFEQQLKHICEQFRTRLYSVLFVCVGRANAELYWRQLMRLLCVPLRSNFRNEALQFLCIYIDPTIPANTDTTDAQQFLVLRCTDAAVTPTTTDEQQATVPPPPPVDSSSSDDVEMLDVAGSSDQTPAPVLPTVTVGSEPWHANFPTDWLPVITRDLQTQSEQSTPQPAFSDAYISGMSAKRRKMIQNDKPSPNVDSLIASGVQRAIQNVNAGPPNGGPTSSSLPVESIVNAIAQDTAVQSSYTEAVRTNARERIKNDPDYKPSKYPQVSKFTEQK